MSTKFGGCLSLAVSLLSVSALVLTGCSDTELRNAANSFQGSVEATDRSIRDYYSNLNEVQRSAYFDHIRFEPKATMSLFSQSKDGHFSTPLVNYIDPKYVDARIKILDLLVNYSKGLALLAASDSPKQVRDQLEEIGANAKKIETDLSMLSNSKSAQIAAYTGFVSTVAGIAMEEILNEKKDKAIRKYVEDGQGAVEQIFTLLKLDLSAIQKVYERSAYAKLSRFVLYYNQNFRTSDQLKGLNYPVNASRVAFLTETKRAALDLSIIKDGNPSRLVDSLELTYQHLVQASKRNTSEDVSGRLLRDLSDVTAQASSISKAVDVLKRELKE